MKSFSLVWKNRVEASQLKFFRTWITIQLLYDTDTWSRSLRLSVGWKWMFEVDPWRVEQIVVSLVLQDEIGSSLVWLLIGCCGIFWHCVTLFFFVGKFYLSVWLFCTDMYVGLGNEHVGVGLENSQACIGGRNFSSPKKFSPPFFYSVRQKRSFSGGCNSTRREEHNFTEHHSWINIHYYNSRCR